VPTASAALAALQAALASIGTDLGQAAADAD
jgi:hypothetical protein